MTATNASVAGRFGDTPEAGGLFLVRGERAGDWTHMGFVEGVHLDADGMPEAIATIEGNANDAGGREGIEVCARTRGLGKLDFVRLGA
jgi:hypothetical protein